MMASGASMVIAMRIAVGARKMLRSFTPNLILRVPRDTDRLPRLSLCRRGRLRRDHFSAFERHRDMTKRTQIGHAGDNRFSALRADAYCFRTDADTVDPVHRA